MAENNNGGKSLREILEAQNNYGGNHIDHVVESDWAAHQRNLRNAGQQQMGQAEQSLATPEELKGPV